MRAALLGLRTSRCSLGAQEALTLHSFFPDTNQIQQHKHSQGQGVCSGCVYVRDRDQDRDIKMEEGKEMKRKKTTLTHKQNASSFYQQLRAFDDVFSYPPLSLSLVKRAITCPAQSHIKQTLVLSTEPDSAKLHCFQMPVTKTR